MIYDRLSPFEYVEFVAGLWRIDGGVAEARARGDVFIRRLRAMGIRDGVRSKNRNCRKDGEFSIPGVISAHDAG